MPSMRAVCNDSHPGKVEEGIEDFENEDLQGWTDGVITSEAAFTKFLGPFYGDAQKPSKSWIISSGADSVRVTFQFYEFDS